MYRKELQKSLLFKTLNENLKENNNNIQFLKALEITKQCSLIYNSPEYVNISAYIHNYIYVKKTKYTKGLS